MNALRDIAEDNNFITYYEDSKCGVVPFESDNLSGFIVMTWYKSRGETGNAVYMFDDDPIQELTEEIALLAIK
jgi:hypothetical protein